MLAQLFSDGWEVQKRIERGNLTASHDGFKVQEPIFFNVSGKMGDCVHVLLQGTVQTAIAQLQDATRLVSELGLFSSNEELEEVSTIDLK